MIDYKISGKDFDRLTAFEKQILFDNLALRNEIHLIIRHLEIINKKHLKKVKKNV
jgi:hypothetical protein